MLHSWEHLGQIVTLGVPSKIFMIDQPDISFRPQFMSTTVPEDGFMSLKTLLWANVSVLYTAEVVERPDMTTWPHVDVYDFCTTGRGNTGIFPLDPDNLDGKIVRERGWFPAAPISVLSRQRIMLAGDYTGLVPKGCVKGVQFKVNFTFVGDVVD